VTQPQTTANQAQAELWNGQAGRNWVEQNALLDRLLEPLVQPLVDAVRRQDARDVLDVGCGCVTRCSPCFHLGYGPAYDFKSP
jgi:hypothetical protein